MRYCAVLHVHSKYSRATSRDCDLEHLAYWGALKGLALIGSGDFTHPAWRAELKEKLVPAEPGLFRLNEASAQRIAAALPAACRNPVRFMLSVEISTIYKKGERTRKIHHLLYVPSFEAAERIAQRLARIGNIAADGRPILGLDSRALLEITLEADASAFLVPAHIWTPWFAVLGSRSGFDSILECYGDLASHIFALETGLSSDPPMNWRVSALDRFRLMSSSDAHSPAKLGREATVFETALDYFALRRALITGEGYGGTVEFFPEEGKYHLDGHRKCAVRLAPEETRRLDGRCPVCGEALTVGVLHRVEALADREEPAAPATAGPVVSLVPLPEILSEISGVGVASQTVARRHERLLGDLGPELEILSTVPLADIARADSSLLAEGIGRLRQGRVLREAGYDGEYGRIRMFERSELEQRTAGGLLFSLPAANGLKAGVESMVAEASPARPTHPGPAATRSTAQAPERAALSTASARLAALDDDQRAAAGHVNGALLVIAGPGSGKTRMLTHRIAHLIADCGAEPSSCLAVTFTRRAAKEMRERLAALLPDRAAQIAIHTFHSLGLSLLKEHRGSTGLHRGFRIATEGERRGVLRDRLGVSEARAEALLRAISRTKRSLGPVPAELEEAMAAYRQGLETLNAVDLDDLIGLALEALETDPLLAARLRGRFRWLSVDEFQDIDEPQYRLIRCLAPPDSNLCVVGDPNQAIYGFRGADASCFGRFARDYADAAVVRLTRNYRSSSTIVAAAGQLVAGLADSADATTPASAIVRAMHERIAIHVASSERAEAEFVVETIERMIGGHSFFSLDSGRAATGSDSTLSFADFAVLYRTDAQSAPLVEALGRSGMPFRKHSHARLVERPAVAALNDALEAERLACGDGLPFSALLDAAAERLRANGADGAEIGEARGVLAAACQAEAMPADGAPSMLALATEADLWDPRADAISLFTLHAAKGLEFPVVFIVGLEDGLLPLRFGAGDSAPLEHEAEERRVFYVGMTRAKDCLVLSRALKRRWRGRLRALPPSPFLTDIERELLRESRSDGKRRRPADLQLDLFS